MAQAVEPGAFRFGSTIQVTKEDEHMDVLTDFLDKYGSDSAIAVTLHSITEIRPRSVVDAIEVRLDGERIGILTPTQTTNIKPVVDFLDERGITAVAKAALRGNRLKADVTLYVSKAHDIDKDWLDHFAKIDPKPRHSAVTRPDVEWDEGDLENPQPS